MATQEKYLDQNGLLYLGQKFEGRYAKQTDLASTNQQVTSLTSKVNELVAEGGEPNVIETVQVNGQALPVTSKTVNVTVPTNNNQLTNGSGYQTAANVQAAISNLVTGVSSVNGKTGAVTLAAADVGAYTTAQTDSAIANAVGGAYKYKGSVATVDDLPTSGNSVGDIYDVQATGTNYAWTGTEWDELGQLFTIATISNSDIDSILGF